MRIRVINIPLSGVGNSGSFGNEKATFGGSLRIIEDGVGLRNVVVGPLSGEWCQYNSEKTMKDKGVNRKKKGEEWRYRNEATCIPVR